MTDAGTAIYERQSGICQTCIGAGELWANHAHNISRVL